MSLELTVTDGITMVGLDDRILLWLAERWRHMLRRTSVSPFFANLCPRNKKSSMLHWQALWLLHKLFEPSFEVQSSVFSFFAKMNQDQEHAHSKDDSCNSNKKVHTVSLRFTTPTDDLQRQILEDMNREATCAEAEINGLRCCFHCLDLPCKPAPAELHDFVPDTNDKSNEQVLEWLNSWWTRMMTMDVPPDECKCITRALCQCFALQHDKCLFFQPGLTGGVSQRKFVCVSLLEMISILLRIWLMNGKPDNSSAVLFNQLKKPNALINRVDLIWDHLPTVMTRDGLMGTASACLFLPIVTTASRRRRTSRAMKTSSTGWTHGGSKNEMTLRGLTAEPSHALCVNASVFATGSALPAAKPGLTGFSFPTS
jgi:hypothetical protein